jgi:hypothetical protein
MSDLPSRTPPLPPPELFERVRGAVAQAAPGPRAPYGVRLVMGLALSLVTVTVVALATQRNFRALPLDRLVMMSAEVSLLAVLAVLLATMRGRHGLGASVTTLAFVSLAVTPLYALATMVAPLAPQVIDPTPPALAWSVRTGLMCSGFGSLIGGIVLAALAFAMRRTVPAAPVTRGAAIGAAAGAATGLALHLFCPHFDRVHLVIGHVLPIAIFVALGALFTPKLLRP